jgi:hypothetical protein
MAGAKLERLGGPGAVKGTIVHAHLDWAKAEIPDVDRLLPPRLSPECRPLIENGVLATEWFPFRCLIDLDRAIAALAGGDASEVFRSLGRRSAAQNLTGTYRAFVAEDPHRLFERTALLHARFQNFGQSSYERLGPRAGRIRVDGCDEYSPAFCESALGFYEGALQTLNMPAKCAEPQCACVGDAACVFEMDWSGSGQGA